MTSNTGSRFTIGSVTDVPIHPNGKNRNGHLIKVTVDGVTHDVHSQRESGAVKLPPELFDHPLSAEIKSAVSKAVIAKLMPGIMAGRRVRELPGLGATQAGTQLYLTS